jgi:hypothetical protein
LGQRPHGCQFVLQAPGLLEQHKDAADAGDVEPVGGQRADLLEPVDVVPAVAAGAAGAAGRVQEALALVDPQRLRVQAGQFGGHRDAEQAAVRIRPAARHHGRSVTSSSQRAATWARRNIQARRSAAARRAADGSGGSTRTGPARRGGHEGEITVTRTGVPAPAGRAGRGSGSGTRAAWS